jgi:hypothetical protein
VEPNVWVHIAWCFDKATGTQYIMHNVCGCVPCAATVLLTLLPPVRLPLLPAAVLCCAALCLANVGPNRQQIGGYAALHLLRL